ncbi:MAG TPA: alpha/beta hydrolase [Stellaceae bacterium]|nr:alpha/beta hydrolase [Stellaceae bacterium]
MQQQAPAAAAARKDPRVYLDYTQSELDAAYDQAVYAPNFQQLQDRRVAGSEAVRQRLGLPERFPYGESAIEQLDVFRAKRANAPIFVFIHGGAWRNGVAKDHAYAAEAFVQSGVTYVVPDFVWVQDAGGSLLPMADQVRRAIAWTWKNAARLGGDPARFYIGGHSSGAHLAGCATIADWEKDWGVPGDFIKGATLCSGMYDLAPVRLSARSQYVSFTDEMVDKLSAIRHIDKIRVPLVLAYGTKETPEFQRQSRDFAAAVKAAGKTVELLVGQHLNHFEMGETFANPLGLLGRAALDQIGVKLIPA